jgi:CBS domain-containing protein
MKVKQVMTKRVVKLTKDLTYQEVVKIFLKHKISGAPVVDEKDQVIGMISEKDLFRVLFPFYKSFYENPECYCNLEEREDKPREIKDDPIENFMIKNVCTVSPETPVMAAGALMLARGIHRLPVVENNKIVGIVSRVDIYRKILKKKLGE